MSLKNAFTIIFGKLMVKTLHLLGRDAGNFPGLVLWTINKDCLKAFKVDCPIVAVTGTNGKTSVTNYLSHIFASGGKKIITNPEGNNLDTGICSLLLNHCDMRGRVHADYLVLETDESHVPVVYSKLNLQTLVLLNFFRDQLDRYGEIDITMNILEEMMRKVPKMQIIVNGDDALSAYLAMDSGNPYVTYGISKPVIKSAANEIREGRFCKRCGEKLEYRFYHARPKPDFDAEDVKVGDQLSFCVEGKHIVANYKGFYNVYNILAAYAGIRTAGFKAEHFNEMLKKFNPENGRNEQFRIKGTSVVLNLAKNPAGFNQNISAVMQDESPKDIIIVINDNAQDGKDISWLWDVDFDLFGGDNINSITVSGIRCQDMRLRLKYVDIPSMLESDVETAIRKRIEDGCGNLYVLVNYTALFGTRNILKKLEGEK